MTKNPKQCPNYEACFKFENQFYKLHEKKLDKVDWGDKNYDKVWDAYHKKEEAALKKFAAKKKIKVCGSSDQLIRIYFRKSVRKKDGYHTYQKLIPFGWYCSKCETVFPEPDLEKKGIGYFHGSYVWPDDPSNL